MHETQRQTSQGDSSFRNVVRGLRLLSNYGAEWNAMATVNAANVEPPLVFYRFFRDELECRHLHSPPWWSAQHRMADYYMPQMQMVKYGVNDEYSLVGQHPYSRDHIITENITANLGNGRSTFINKLIDKWWSNSVYNHCKYVHCPTQTVKEHLEANGYTSELRVISNGIDLSQTPSTISEPSTPPYRILCVGRLSNEKDQTTLIKAIRYSKYADKIELVFAGNGPKANKIKSAARKLFEDGVVKHEPTFGFYTLKQLQELAASSWLYVHCAKIEVEGLSCLEAIQQGLVPVIAKGKLTATAQFALDEHSTFPTSDYKALAERIDWWIEHPDHRKQMSRLYAESVQKYSNEVSTRKIIEMYEDALRS